MTIKDFIREVGNYNVEAEEAINKRSDTSFYNGEDYSREPDKFDIEFMGDYMLVNYNSGSYYKNNYILLKFNLKTGEFELNMNSDLTNVYEMGVNPILHILYTFLTTGYDYMEINEYLGNRKYSNKHVRWED